MQSAFNEHQEFLAAQTNSKQSDLIADRKRLASTTVEVKALHRRWMRQRRLDKHLFPTGNQKRTHKILSGPIQSFGDT